MKIEHMDGSVTDTNKLPDLDAILLEESKKLHELFRSHNRQAFIAGDMKTKKDGVAKECVFFHIAQPLPEGVEPDKEQMSKDLSAFYSRIDRLLRGMTNNQLGVFPVALMPPPPEIPI